MSVQFVNGEYHSDRHTLSVDSISTAILLEAAAIESTEVTDLPLLSDWIDAEQLDRMFDPQSFSNGFPDFSVKFEYYLWNIHIEPTGQIVFILIEDKNA